MGKNIEKKIIISLIAIILSMIVGYVYVQVIDQKATHYCADRDISVHCDEFSTYYGLLNGKCVNYRVPNFLCKTGWEEIHEYDTVENGKLVKKWR